MTIRIKALIALLIASILWSSAPTVGKLLVAHADPFVIVFYRFAIASVIIFPFFLREKKTTQLLLQLVPVALCNAFNALFYYSGIKLTTANAAAIIGISVPLIVAVLAPIVIRETISRKRLAGVLIGLFGVVCIVVLPLIQKGESLSGNFLGNLLIIGSALSWSFYVLLSRKMLANKTSSPLVATSMNFFVTTIITGLVGMITGQSFMVQSITVTYIGVLLFAAIGITICTYFLFQWAVQHISAITASLKEYVQLVGGIAINGIILGEKFTFGYFIGAVLVVFGVIVASEIKLPRQLKILSFWSGN